MILTRTAATLPPELAYIVLICGAFTTVCVAAGWLIKIIAAIRKPESNQNERISKLEGEVKTLKEFLANNNVRLNAIERGNRVTQEALLALLDHAIDGNNVKALEMAKAGLHNYLLDRGSSVKGGLHHEISN